jgi:hypothetical protein
MVVTSYEELPPTTRVWIYQSNRPFTDAEIPRVRDHIRQFVSQWISHNQQLKAYGDILHGLFIVLMVDESQAGASGCSIDKSVYFLKKLGQAFEVDLFDRMVFAYREGERAVPVSRPEFQTLYQQGKLSDETPVFDTLVNNKEDFESKWIKPLGESWHKRML